MAEQIKNLKIEVLGFKGKRVRVKIERLRKPRDLIAYMDGKYIIAQGDNVIFKINPENGLAIYNLKGEYFLHLNPAMGAKFGRVPREFIDALLKVIYKEGDLIGFLPSDLGGSPVYFGNRPY